MRIGPVPLPPIWREGLLGLELASLLRHPLFSNPPEAPAARPVMLIPGFLTGDAQMATLGSWLRRCGHRTTSLGDPAERGLLCRLDRPARAAPGGLRAARGRAGGADRAEPRRSVCARARGPAAGPRARRRDARLAARATRTRSTRWCGPRAPRSPAWRRSACRAWQAATAAAARAATTSCGTSGPLCRRACSSSRSIRSGDGIVDLGGMPGPMGRERRGALHALRHGGQRRGVRAARRRACILRLGPATADAGRRCTRVGLWLVQRHSSTVKPPCSACRYPSFSTWLHWTEKANASSLSRTILGD